MNFLPNLSGIALPTFIIGSQSLLMLVSAAGGRRQGRQTGSQKGS